MADVSKITLPKGEKKTQAQTYDIKDATARQSINSVQKQVDSMVYPLYVGDDGFLRVVIQDNVTPQTV